MSPADGLTAKQRAFVVAYLATRRPNATRAAELAGYAWPGKQGPRLLTHPAIAAIVRPALERREAERLAELDRRKVIPRRRARGWKRSDRRRRM